MSQVTGTVTELIYASTAAGTVKSSFTSTTTINDTTAMGPLPILPAGFWMTPTFQGELYVGRAVRIVARGILSSTGTPTFTLTAALSPGPTAAVTVTTGSSVSNAFWQYEVDVILLQRTASDTLSFSTAKTVLSGGIQSPFIAATVATPSSGPISGYWSTSTISLKAACSVSSPSNSIQLQQLLVFGLT